MACFGKQNPKVQVAHGEAPGTQIHAGIFNYKPLLCALGVVGIVLVVLVGMTIGILYGIVLAQTSQTQPTQAAQLTQAPQPQSTQSTQPQSTQSTQPQPTQATQRHPSQAPQQTTVISQSQPTQAPQFRTTQAAQPQLTQAPQQPTVTPQSQPTQAPQFQTTQTPQPQPTQAPQQHTEGSQPQPTETPQPQTTEAPQQTTDPTVVIEGDIFDTGICGTRPVLDNRILGGSNSNLGTWPWIGALLNNNEQGCGATLINSRWAVTAAHCIVDPGFTPPDSIAFGLIDLTNHGSFSQQSGFLRMITHPSYDSNDSAAEYDITLLHLSQTIQFTNYVRPVCLATLEQETSVYSSCYATGWGALSEPPPGSSYENGDPAEYPDILQEVGLPLISSSDCNAIDDRVTSNIICAAGTSQGGLDTCQGDSGGPLVCESSQDDFWHLVGIVSTGEGCGRPNTPGFYTRVSHFISWIESTVAQYA